jgi:hypothetical protein
MASNPRVTERTQADRAAIARPRGYEARGSVAIRSAFWRSMLASASALVSDNRSVNCTLANAPAMPRREAGVAAAVSSCRPYPSRVFRDGIAAHHRTQKRAVGLFLRRCFDPVGSGVGSRAFRFESVIFVREIRFDISRQPPQPLSRARRDRGVSGSGRTMAKERRMRLEVSAFHNVPQLAKPAVLISDGENEPFQRLYVVNEIFAPDVVLRTEMSDPGLCSNIRASRTRPINLTFLIGARVGFSLPMCEISSGSSTSPTKRSVANVLMVFLKFVIILPRGSLR